MKKLILKDYPYYKYITSVLKTNLRELERLSKYAKQGASKYFLDNKSHPGLSASKKQQFTKEIRSQIRQSLNVTVDHNNILESFIKNLDVIKYGAELGNLLDGYSPSDVDKLGEHIDDLVLTTKGLQKTICQFEELFDTFNKFISELSVNVVATIPQSNNSFTTLIKVKLPKSRQELFNKSNGFYDMTHMTFDSPILNRTQDDPDTIYEFRLSDVAAKDEVDSNSPYLYSADNIFFGEYRNGNTVDEIEFFI